MNACPSEVAVAAYPVICPLALMPSPQLFAPPRVPKSVMTPPLYRNACIAPLATGMQPVAWPFTLMPRTDTPAPRSISERGSLPAAGEARPATIAAKQRSLAFITRSRAGSPQGIQGRSPRSSLGAGSAYSYKEGWRGELGYQNP